jgi:hypothetical protein
MLLFTVTGIMHDMYAFEEHIFLSLGLDTITAVIYKQIKYHTVTLWIVYTVQKQWKQTR